jgi:hypothetical protein
MKRILPGLVVLLLASSLWADPGAEIASLLDAVAESRCIFLRNGREHSGQEAADHLRFKYQKVRSRITTAEIFIDRIASSSSITKRPYRVRCGVAETDTNSWLYTVLKKLRKTENNGT